VRVPAEVPLTDEDLLAACLRGEQAAWNALVDRYAALIYSIPLKHGLSEHDAADVFQSVCMTLLEKLDSIRDPRGLPAWIITTTSRQSWALLRQQGREITRPGQPSEMADDEPIDPEPLPDEEIVALESQHLVRTAMNQLSPNCRRLLEALFSDTQQRVSYQELARQLGVPLNSLGPTRTRCLAKLRQLLDAVGFAGS
jgi:RNA polymerase sigma factor (sigma-70 family)